MLTPDELWQKFKKEWITHQNKNIERVSRGLEPTKLKISDMSIILCDKQMPNPRYLLEYKRRGKECSVVIKRIKKIVNFK